MVRLRMFLAWLLLLAIPLQGLAAASMSYCGPTAKAQAQQTQAAHEHHDHDMQGQSGATNDHAKHHHQAVSDTGEQTSGTVLPDAGHKCSICAACCNAVAITETPQVPTFSAAPQIIWAEPLVLAYSRPTPVPDKPPRV
jgi:hypothetical protein